MMLWTTIQMDLSRARDKYGSSSLRYMTVLCSYCDLLLIAKRWQERELLCTEQIQLHHQTEDRDEIGEAEAWYDLGYTQAQLQKHEEAAVAFQNALTLVGKHGEVFASRFPTLWRDFLKICLASGHSQLRQRYQTEVDKMRDDARTEVMQYFAPEDRYQISEILLSQAR